MTQLQSIFAGANAATRLDENFETMSAAAIFGKRQAVTAGLVWGGYGGLFNGNTIADWTANLTDGSDNYIMVDRATGCVSACSANTNWSNVSYARLYKVTVASNLVTAVVDSRYDTNGFLQPTAGGNGTVTSVGLVMPAAVFTVANTPVSTTGNLTVTFATQNAGLIFAGPATGNAAAPTFRALALTDIPVGANNQILSTVAGVVAWANSSAGGNGTVTSVGLTMPSAVFTVANSPVTTAGNLAVTFATQNAGMIFAGPATGNATTPSFRALALTDIPVGANNQVLSTVAGVVAWANASAGGNGTVTSVGLNMPAIFTVANTPVTTAGNIVVSLANQSVSTVFAGPSSGNSAAPTFRALVGGDMPVHTINTQTANYTLALSDGNVAWVEMNSANDKVITVPSHANVAFANGVFIPISRLGAGNVTIAAQANVTVHNSSSSTLRVQYSVGGLYCRTTDEWMLFGDLT